MQQLSIDARAGDALRRESTVERLFELIQIATFCTNTKPVLIGIEKYSLTCSDSGEITLLDLSTSPPSIHQKILPGKNNGGHDLNSLITSCAYIPPPSKGNPSPMFLTGGTDCKICLWDYSNLHKPASTLYVQPLQSDSSSQSFNPPFVHSIDTSEYNVKGKQIAVGLGDGSILLLEISIKKELQLITRLSGHGLNVGTVNWSKMMWGETEDNKSKYLTSGSNEGKVAIWDITSNSIVDGVLHTSGPNCVKAGLERGRVFVADVGKDIHVYDLLIG